MPQKIAAGNWKMNGTSADLSQAKEIAAADSGAVQSIICPPATLLAQISGVGLASGGQDCHPNQSGAHTGDISAEMLKDAGAEYVILGHSERRADHGESNEMIAAKVSAAWGAGLTAILCIGETESQRDAGTTIADVTTQLVNSLPDGATPENTVIAYEPIWAIGTGRTATPAEIAEVHDALRAHLVGRFGDETGNDISLLYGGSVKAGNADEIFAVDNVNGALVGGASLTAQDFVPIISALDRS